MVITVDPAAPLLSGILKVPGTPATITTLTTVAFTAVEASSSGPIDQFEIDFGDGTGGQGATPTFSHAYGAAGSYVVRMRARGPLGDWSPWVARTFTVVDPARAGCGDRGKRAGHCTDRHRDAGRRAVGGLRPDRHLAVGGQARSGCVAVHGPGRQPFLRGGRRLSDQADRGIAGRGGRDGGDAQSITITVPPPPDILALNANPVVPTASVVVNFTPVVTGSVATWEWDYEGGADLRRDRNIGRPAHLQHCRKQAVYLRVTGPFGGQDIPLCRSHGQPAARTLDTRRSSGRDRHHRNDRRLHLERHQRSTGLTWNWTGTNGSSTFTYPNAGPSISHLFATAGSWTVTVAATDCLGVTGIASSFVTVQDPLPPLVAGFTWTVTATPLQVQFTDTSTGPPIASWSWTFVGPGAVGPATVPDPLVTFPVAGLYTVELTVTSGAAVDSLRAQVTVP